MKWELYFTSAFILLTIFPSCQQKESASFLAIGHTRQDEKNDTKKVVAAIEKIPFKKYDAVLLGGDLVLESTVDKSQLEYLDKIFDLKSPNTLWALGNHDYRDHPEYIFEFTNRPNYYSHQIGDITFFVFDTQLDSCNITGRQLGSFNKTISKLRKGDQIIILHHKLIWMPDHPILDTKTHATTNGMVGDCFYCLMRNNFYQDVYPQLVKLEKSGVEVIMVAGDIGSKVNQFEFETKEGITFLATGIEDEKPNNQVLILTYEEGSPIKWEFKPLAEIVK